MFVLFGGLTLIQLGSVVLSDRNEGLLGTTADDVSYGVPVLWACLPCP